MKRMTNIDIRIIEPDSAALFQARSESVPLNKVENRYREIINGINESTERISPGRSENIMDELKKNGAGIVRKILNARNQRKVDNNPCGLSDFGS